MHEWIKNLVDKEFASECVKMASIIEQVFIGWTNLLLALWSMCGLWYMHLYTTMFDYSNYSCKGLSFLFHSSQLQSVIYTVTHLIRRVSKVKHFYLHMLWGTLVAHVNLRSFCWFIAAWMVVQHTFLGSYISSDLFTCGPCVLNSSRSHVNCPWLQEYYWNTVVYDICMKS